MGLKLVMDVAVKSMEKVGVSRFRLEDVSEDLIVRELPKVVKKYENSYDIYVGEGRMNSGSSDIRYVVIMRKIERSEE